MPNLDNHHQNSPASASSAAAGMETRRLIRYPLSYVKLALMDMTETLGGRCTRDRCELSGNGLSDTDLELNVFGRVSHYTFSIRAENGFCRLRIRFLTADAELSAEGRRRSLRYLADVLEQTIENSLIADNLKKNPSVGPDNQMHPASNAPVAPEAEPPAKTARGWKGLKKMLKTRRTWLLLSGGVLLLLAVLLTVLWFLHRDSKSAGGGFVRHTNGQMHETTPSTAPQALIQSLISPAISTETTAGKQSGSPDTSPAGSIGTQNELKRYEHAGLGLVISLPADMSYDADAYGFYAIRGDHTRIQGGFYYALGAPLYRLSDFDQNAKAIVSYALADYGIEANVILSENSLNHSEINGIPVTECTFSLEGEHTICRLFVFPAKNGPGCYTLFCAQNPDDPAYTTRNAELSAVLASLSLTGAAPQTTQEIVLASHTGLQMVYDTAFGIPNGIEDGELFHMYFDDSQFATGVGNINVFDISDKADSLEDALYFVFDQMEAYAVTEEPEVYQTYQHAGKNIKTLICKFVYSDDPAQIQMETSIHVIQAGGYIFALQGQYDQATESDITRQLDIIGLSIDVQH